MRPPRRPGIDDEYVERPEGEILIQYGAIANANKHRGGWMPQVWVNGHAHGDSYGRGYDRDSALQLAKEEALEKAARFLGDWKIVIEPRDNAPAAGLRRRVHER
jgi:hypothetical protein